MSPEQRAENVISLLKFDGSWNDWVPPEVASLIATAIKEAKDAAYERAGVAAINASRGMSCFVGLDDCQLFNQGVRAAEQSVLALKSQEI